VVGTTNELLLGRTPIGGFLVREIESISLLLSRMKEENVERQFKRNKTIPLSFHTHPPYPNNP